MRIKLIVSYDGTNYCGWQRQKNSVSIQETIEDAIAKATGENVVVTASGRTDAGVHAKGQVCHFDTFSTIPPDKFDKAINPHLPIDIKVLSSSLVSNEFNARKSAKKKTYAYSFYLSSVELPLRERYSHRLEKEVDFDAMNIAKQLFIGEHDFKAFSKVGSSVKTTVRTIYSIDIIKENDGFSIVVCGSGFLYNMVRIIAGAIVEVGQKRLLLEDLKKAFSTNDRSVLGKTLPAKGLTLIKVEY